MGYMEDHHVELPIPGEDFTQNDAYDAGKAPTRSDPRELEQVRKRHREEMEEVDADPDSGPVSPILLPQRPKRQCMIPTLEGVSERMNAFLNPPDKEDDSVELILDEDTREYTPPAKKVDLVRYIHENPVEMKRKARIAVFRSTTCATLSTHRDSISTMFSRLAPILR